MSDDAPVGLVPAPHPEPTLGSQAVVLALGLLGAAFVAWWLVAAAMLDG
ncbi:hypothetical protein [Demequina soli]|nr:hypothetical protein [Demequina soli]